MHYFTLIVSLFQYNNHHHHPIIVVVILLVSVLPTYTFLLLRFILRVK
jgi:hypothetical protein